MEVLLEYRGSRRQITVSSGESLTECVTTELRRVGRARASVHTANANLSSNVERDVYILQKWSPQWDCYVDVYHVNEISDGDRVTVVSKPRPPSKVLRLLCCCCSSPDAGVVISQRRGVTKNEEIQALDYRFAKDSDTNSNWEMQSASPTEERGADHNQYVRDSSGRAAWKMVPTQSHDEPEPPVDDQPADSEEPLVDDQPADSEEPLVDDQPADSEEPLVDDQPADSEEPLVDDQPADSEEPLVDDQPADSEEPLVDDQPADSDQPEATEDEGEQPADDEAMTPTEDEVAADSGQMDQDAPTPEESGDVNDDADETGRVVIEVEERVTPTADTPVQGEPSVTISLGDEEQDTTRADPTPEGSAGDDEGQSHTNE